MYTYFPSISTRILCHFLLLPDVQLEFVFASFELGVAVRPAVCCCRIGTEGQYQVAWFCTELIAVPGLLISIVNLFRGQLWPTKLYWSISRPTTGTWPKLDASFGQPPGVEVPVGRCHFLDVSNSHVSFFFPSSSLAHSSPYLFTMLALVYVFTKRRGALSRSCVPCSEMKHIHHIYIGIGRNGFIYWLVGN
jgi:hypothetical protein